jgi:hypothetical protein
MMCVICMWYGHEVHGPDWECPRCSQDPELSRFKSARVVGVEMTREWVDPTIH